MADFKYVNKPVHKIDGMSLVTGQEQYTDDFRFKNTLHISVMHSGYAFAKITDIDDSVARKMHGVVEVLHHKNVKKILYTTAGQGYPEPSPYDCQLFNDTMRFVGDNICAVAAETKEIADAALENISVKFDVLKPILDFHESDGNDIKLHGEDGAFVKIPVFYDADRNIASMVEAEVGNFEEGYANSPLKLEHSFYAPYASHCAIEPHAAQAYIDNRGRLVIISTTQVPFHVRRIVSQVTEIPISKIRVIKPRIGGGFGGKQEILLEPIVAMFAWKTKRPCKLVYTRREVFKSCRCRHEYDTTLKVGYTPDGEIKAIHMDALENSGAYGSHALTVLSNAGSKTLPLLNKVPDVKFTGKGVYSNLPVGGAYRGYGATEAVFAYGQAVDMVCEETGQDIVEYYKKNCIKSGETSPIFQALGEGKEGVAMNIGSTSLLECLEVGAELSDWKVKKALYGPNSDYNKGKRLKRGIGMVAMMQGSAIPEIDMASAYIKMNDDGSFNLSVGATDLGTGSDTVLAQIASEVLDTPVENFIVYSSDTDHTPFDVGAYASSTTYLSGMAVKKCATEIKNQVLKVGAEILGLEIDQVKLDDSRVLALVADAEYEECSFEEIARYSLYSKNQFQIQATASHVSPKSPPPFAVHFIEIEVDTYTGVIKVLDYVATVDCGTPINTTLSEGQVEGAIVNGLAYALFEDYYFSEHGKMQNDTFGRMGMYVAKDIPPITVRLLKSYEDSGPFGAKSISEININGALPAIGNAFYNATGKRLFKAPFYPEYVYNVLKGKA